MDKEDLLKELNSTDKYTLELDDLRAWAKDYREVHKQVNEWLEEVKDKFKDEKVDYLISKMHNNNAYDICCDLSCEPIEYIDFNYGSLTCTISIIDRPIPELSLCFEGYIRRDDKEVEGYFTDVKIYDVEEIIKESEV